MSADCKLVAVAQEPVQLRERGYMCDRHGTWAQVSVYGNQEMIGWKACASGGDANTWNRRRSESEPCARQYRAETISPHHLVTHTHLLVILNNFSDVRANSKSDSLRLLYDCPSLFLHPLPNPVTCSRISHCLRQTVFLERPLELPYYGQKGARHPRRR
jgi:hypothetical protein